MNYTLALLQSETGSSKRVRMTCLTKVTAESPLAAKKVFARVNGLLGKPAWDSSAMTFYGWPIVEIREFPH